MKDEKGETVTGHIISTTIGGKNGEPKRVSSVAKPRFSLSVCPADAWLNVAGFLCPDASGFAVGISRDLVVR